MKRIGLIGGLAFRAGIFYYDQLLRRCSENGIALELVLMHADVNKVLKLVRDNNRQAIGEYLGSLSNDLLAAGADLVAITAVAPHLAISETQDISSVPLVNVLDCVTRGISDAGLNRVAILGNRKVIETNIFGSVANGVVVQLDSKTIQVVHDTYNDIALNGKRGTQRELDYFESLAKDLSEKYDVQAIVLAGTDLSSFYADNPPSFPFIDVAALHIEQIMKALTTEIE
jgi:aspartate racemase